MRVEREQERGAHLVKLKRRSLARELPAQIQTRLAPQRRGRRGRRQAEKKPDPGSPASMDHMDSFAICEQVPAGLPTPPEAAHKREGEVPDIITCWRRAGRVYSSHVGRTGDRSGGSGGDGGDRPGAAR